MKKSLFCLCIFSICASLQCFAATKPPVDPDEIDTTDVLAIPLDESAGEENQEDAALKKMENKEQKPAK